MGARPSWGEVVDRAAAELGPVDPEDARRIAETVAGLAGSAWHQHRDEDATVVGETRIRELVARRAAGEPLQYVLGEWSFRTIEVMVDPRVLIPRPETEVVAGFALEEIDRLAAGADRPVRVVDLGTGSGVLGLSIAVERIGTSVVLADVSEAALSVARANTAGVGRSGTRVRVRQGSWFEALVPEAQRFDVIVSNPPYVADAAPLPAEVADWEPVGALRSGPDGLDDIRQIVAGAPEWLTPGGALVVELSPEQAGTVQDLARAAGFAEVSIRPDLAGRDRALVARVAP